MEQKKLTIEISPLMASVLSRLLANEKAYQGGLALAEEESGDLRQLPTRVAIIEECDALRDYLHDEAGVWYCD